MVDLNKIKSQDEQNILKLYQEYRKSDLHKKPNEEILQEINAVFLSLFAG